MALRCRNDADAPDMVSQRRGYGEAAHAFNLPRLFELANLSSAGHSNFSTRITSMVESTVLGHSALKFVLSNGALKVARSHVA